MVKSDEYRLYNWVESFHKTYQPYKLGRQLGSLTDKRVVSMIKQGFCFGRYEAHKEKGKSTNFHSFSG